MPPTRSKRLLLERAENLGLQRQRQIANLVEEERPAMRQLEPSRLARGGAGERPLLVAEQLRFEQVFRDRRAVDGDERAVGPRAEHVQRAREQLLARAALAFDQDRRVVGGRRAVQRLRDLLQPRIFTDDLGRAAPLRELLFEEEVFGRQPPLHQRALDEQQQVIGIDRLGEKIERAFLHRRDGVLDVAERRHHDDGQLGIELLGGAQHAEPVAFGQPEIGQHHGGTHRSEARRPPRADRALR